MILTTSRRGWMAAWLAPSSVSRGYTLPVLDLAGDTARQTIVDRVAGQYLGHPTTCLLADGRTLLCVYPEGHGKGPIVLRRSPDAGRTWSPRLPVPANWATSLETPTIHRVGRRRLLLFSGLHPIRRAVSEDEGRTWTPLEPIGDFGGIVAMSDLLNRRDGSLVAFFHDDGRFFAAQPAAESAFVVYRTESRDGGERWSRPEAVARHARAHLCEPGIARSPEGRQWAMLLRENSRQFNSFVCFSGDEGRTWSEPREVPGALTGDRHVAKYLPDGRLFVTFRDTTHESRTRGDWVAWVGTWRDLAEGREGELRVRLMKNHRGADCAYAGLEVLKDGTIVTTTYGHWTAGEMPYVVCVRLAARELRAPRA